MSKPPQFNRDHDFVQDEISGRDTLDGNSLNRNLDDVADSVNSVISQQAIIQRDDGQLRAGVVSADALAPGVESGIVDASVAGVLPYSESAADSAAIALREAHSAKSDAASASESAGLAAGSAANAGESEIQAGLSAAGAQQSAVSSGNEAVLSSNSANLAASQAAAASLNELNAMRWAEYLAGPVMPADPENPVPIPPGSAADWVEAVDDGHWSARYWAWWISKNYGSGGISGINFRGEATVAEINAMAGDNRMPGDAWLMVDSGVVHPGSESVIEGDLIAYGSMGYWVNLGQIEGTEGPMGPQGPQGNPGADSTVPGPVGPVGPQGEIGPSGADGADSDVPGPVGPEGPAGPQGEQGIQGEAGEGALPDGDDLGQLSVWDGTDWKNNSTLRVGPFSGVYSENSGANLMGKLSYDGQDPFKPYGKLGQSVYVVGDSLTSPNGGGLLQFSYSTNGSGVVSDLKIVDGGSGMTRDVYMSQRGPNSAMFWFWARVSGGSVASVEFDKQSDVFPAGLTDEPFQQHSTTESWAHMLWNRFALDGVVDATPATSVSRPGTEYQFFNVPAASEGDIALIALGGNDAGGIECSNGFAPGGQPFDITQADFEAAYTTLLTNFQNAGYRVIVKLSPYSDIGLIADDPTWDEGTSVIRQGQKNVAAALGITEVWDYVTTNLSDYLHMTQDGQDYWCQAVYANLLAVCGGGGSGGLTSIVEVTNPDGGTQLDFYTKPSGGSLANHFTLTDSGQMLMAQKGGAVPPEAGFRNKNGDIQFKGANGLWAVMIGAAPADGEQYVQKDGGWSLLPEMTSSQWDDVTGGINYAGGNVGIASGDLVVGDVITTDVANDTVEMGYGVNNNGVGWNLKDKNGGNTHIGWIGAGPTTGASNHYTFGSTGVSRWRSYDGTDYTTAMEISAAGNLTLSGTVDGRDVAADGTKLDGIATSANNYVHPSYSSTDINTSGATIVDIISTNSTGHVTQLGTRTLTAANIGAQATIGNDLTFTSGGGWFMSDTTWVRSKNNKAVYNASTAVTAFATPGDFTAGYSDMRLKTHLGTIPDALDKVCSLEGFYYERNDAAQSLGYQGGERRVGLSAQDVQAVLPEVVKDAPINIDHGTDYLTIDYERVVPLLVESIKDLRAEIAALRSELHGN